MSRIDLYPNLKSPPSDAKVATGTALPGDKFAIDVSIAGGTSTVSINAPTGPFEITVGTATDVATNPLPTPLTDRVSLSVRNLSNVSTIYVGKDNTVTADNTATGGWEIFPRSDFNLDLNDSNSIYFITPSGETALYKIFEIAST